MAADVNGGQNARPAAESVLTFGLSAANRYKVRPLASVSVLPNDVCLTDIAEFAGTAAKFKSRVSVVKDGQTVNAKSSIDLLTLAAVAGTRLTLRAEGDDADLALDALSKLIDGKFGEE